MSDKTPEQIDLSFCRQEARTLWCIHQLHLRMEHIISRIHDEESTERATAELKKLCTKLNAL